MIKNLLKLGLTIAACSILLPPREASADSAPFPNQRACDDYMDHAHAECLVIAGQCPTSGVTAKMCETSWEVTYEYCETQYRP